MKENSKITVDNTHAIRHKEAIIKEKEEINNAIVYKYKMIVDEVNLLRNQIEINKEMTNTFPKLQNENLLLKQESTNFKYQIEKLDNENKELNQRCQHVNQEKSSFEIQIETLQRKIKEMEDKLEKQNKYNKELLDKIDNLNLTNKITNSKQEEEIKNKDKKLKQLITQNAELETKLIEYENKNREATELIIEETKKNKQLINNLLLMHENEVMELLYNINK